MKNVLKIILINLYSINFIILAQCNLKTEPSNENKIINKEITASSRKRKCKTVFITGANSGIGKATVEEFAKKGWNVAATIRKPKLLDMFKKYKNVKTYLMDVTDYDRVNEVSKQAIKDFGNIDALINNAAFLQIGPVETTTMQQYENIYKANVFGLMAVCKAFIPHMRKNRDGVILNVSSANAIAGLAFFSGYSSTKMAVVGFSDSLGSELEQFNIKVKVVFPGFHESGIFKKEKTDVGKDKKGYEAYKPLLIKFNKIFMSIPSSPPGSAGKDFYKFATDESDKTEYYTGKDIKLRKLFIKIFGKENYKRMLNKVTRGEGIWPKIYSMRKGNNSRPGFDI
ncbi:MAG: SDR family oxidoreductase [Bacteroidetes bacterium]|nr:SDR family oxidoreductase [Bacteroidota bacterium]